MYVKESFVVQVVEINVENGHEFSTRVQILGEAFCISHKINIQGEGKLPTIHPSDMSK